MTGSGLNKAARLLAERLEREKLAAPPPLEPDFPFQVEVFDALFFGVDESAGEKPAALT